jgi:hypothetical protein
VPQFQQTPVIQPRYPRLDLQFTLLPRAPAVKVLTELKGSVRLHFHDLFVPPED